MGRWHTGFVDVTGTQGLLGQVEGRAASDAVAWLEQQPESWREQVRFVVIDMSASYRAAILQALPAATIVVDTSTWSSWPARRCARCGGG